MAIQSFPAYLVGTHVSGAVVVGCTVASTGVVTPGSGGVDLAATGFVDDMTITRTRTLSQVQPINSLLDNFVPLASGFTMTLSEIRHGDGSSALNTITQAYTYVEVTFNVTPPGGSASYTEAVIGVIESTEMAYVAEKCVITMTVRPIGLASYGGAYSATPFGS